MKTTLVILILSLASCTPAYGYESDSKEVAALVVHLEITQEVLKELKTTLEKTNETLNAMSLNLTTLQGTMKSHAERIERLEQGVAKQDGVVATLIDEKKKLNNLLTFLCYFGTAIVIILGFCKKSHLRSVLTGQPIDQGKP